MGKINFISDDMLRVLRREMRKHGYTLVRNKKTGDICLRQLTTKPQEDTPAKSAARIALAECSRRASEWIKSNSPDSCPPNGTDSYQKAMKAFKRQDKVKRFLNFVMSRKEYTL